MVIVGIDLSLTASGLCAIPSDWDHDWNRLTFETFRTKPDDYPFSVERLGRIATRVTDFVRRTEATHVYIEDYPRHIRSSSVHGLVELGGAVKLRVLEWTGLDCVPVPISSARKLFLGKLPKLEPKRICLESLRSVGAVFDGDAESDAFVVANYGLSEQGLWCVSAA